MRDLGITCPIAIDASGAAKTIVFERYQSPHVGSAVPLSYVTDAQGKVADAFYGKDTERGTLVLGKLGVEPFATAVAALAAADEERGTYALGSAAWRTADGHRRALDVLPENSQAREFLGRICVRHGGFGKALAVLDPQDQGRSELHRAFCFDALGQREKALSIYRQFSQLARGSTAGLWAEHGLAEPTWPHDVDIPGGPGEVRALPSTRWHASASASTPPAEPRSAIDGKRDTLWLLGGRRYGHERGEWFQLDFDEPLHLTRIVLDHYGEASIYLSSWARGLKAEISADGKTWTNVDVSPAGVFQFSTVKLASTKPTKGIRFTTTGHDPEHWGIGEVFAFAPLARQPSRDSGSGGQGVQ